MSRDSNVNVKANINGRDMDPASVASLLDVLFRGGWLEDVIKTALTAPRTVLEHVNTDMNRQVSALRERLEQAVRRAEAAASGRAQAEESSPASGEARPAQPSEESEPGEDT